MNYNKKLYNALKSIAETYQKLSDKLLASSNDPIQIVALNKKIAQVEQAYYGFLKFDKFVKNYQQAQSIIESQDLDLLELAEIEFDQYKQQLPQLENELQLLLIPKDPNEHKDVIIEMRPAAGGDESSIFVNNLFDAYKRYAVNNN